MNGVPSHLATSETSSPKPNEEHRTRRAPRLIRPFTGGIAWTAIWGLVGVLSEIGVVITIAGAIDAGAVTPVALLVMLGLFVVRSICRALEERLGEQVASNVRVRGTELLSRHLLTVGPQLADDQRTGDLVSRAVPGLDAVARMAGRFLPLVARAVFGSFLVAIVAMVLDLWTGLALLISLPLIPLVLRLLERRFRTTADELRSASNRLTAQFLDSFQGLTTLRMFDRGADRATVLENDAEQLRKRTMDLLRVNQTALVAVDLAQAIASTLLVTGVLWHRIDVAAVTVGEAVALVLLAWLAVLPYVRVVNSIYIGALGSAALGQIRELFALPISPPGRTKPGYEPDGSIRVHDVTLRYDNGVTALNQISLDVAPGSRVAIIGESGSGKSSLADVLLGLRVPQEGRVVIGGGDRAHVDPAWLRSAITYVGQNTHIFSMTVADNLRIAKPTATAGELIEVCRLAEIHDFIAGLDRGYDTVIGDRGTTLSMGQAQRIGIARAFLANTSVIVADEATSGLDLDTERRVTRALRRVTRGRTLVLIAHRRSTIVDVDRVIVLSLGRITYDGTPAEVMSRSPLLSAMRGRHQG